MIVDKSLSILDCERPELYRRDSSMRGYTFREERMPPLSMSLGWELEANRASEKTPAGVMEHSDRSVHGDSMEYVVMPTVVTSPSYVLTLLKELVYTAGLNTDSSCGFHVHMAPRKVTKKLKRKWALMVEKLAKQIEEKAFRAVPPSRQSNSFCKRILLTENGTFFNGSKYDNSRRYHWVNVVEMFRPSGINTVEIRLLGNTHRWRYLLAWVAFCMELGLQGWRVMHRVETMEKAVARLTLLLSGIEREIKPLQYKRNDVPAWVWVYLKQHGIKKESFDRPIKGLAELELRVKNPTTWIMPYTDLQPSSSDEENGVELCDHGNDYENDGCLECDHDTGNCNGSPNCEYCVWDRHAENEDCGYSRCRRCMELREREAV